MRTSDILIELASNLESEDNEILVRASLSDNEESLKIVADSLVSAAETLKCAAEKLDEFGADLSSDDLESIAAIASEFDASGDPDLQKQASVLDELLMTIGITQEQIQKIKSAKDEEINNIRERMRESQGKDLYTRAQEPYKEEGEKAVTEALKDYRPLEAPLSTRTCPDHPGAQMQRIADAVYQCSLDKQIYNYNDGFTTMKGNKVPGTSVANQSQVIQTTPSHTMFTTRQHETSKE